MRLKNRFFAFFCLVFRRKLLIPDLAVKNLNYIDPKKLRSSGIKAIIFDKDNTLTKLWEYEINSLVKKKLNEFKREFGKNIVVISNKMGTELDRGFEQLDGFKKKTKLPSLIHKNKKPNKIKEINNYFKVPFEKTAVIGDKVFTDVLFGNRYGMFTIYVEPFSKKNEGNFVYFLRKLGDRFVNQSKIKKTTR